MHVLLLFVVLTGSVDGLMVRGWSRGPWIVSWSVSGLVVRGWSCGPWVFLWSVSGLWMSQIFPMCRIQYTILDSVSCDFRFVKILL